MGECSCYQPCLHLRTPQEAVGMAKVHLRPDFNFITFNLIGNGFYLQWKKPGLSTQEIQARSSIEFFDFGKKTLVFTSLHFLVWKLGKHLAPQIVKSPQRGSKCESGLQT